MPAMPLTRVASSSVMSAMYACAVGGTAAIEEPKPTPRSSTNSANKPVRVRTPAMPSCDTSANRAIVIARERVGDHEHGFASPGLGSVGPTAGW